MLKVPRVRLGSGIVAVASGHGHAIVNSYAIWKQKQKNEVYLRLLLLLNTIADGILGGVIIWEAQHCSPTEPHSALIMNIITSYDCRSVACQSAWITSRWLCLPLFSEHLLSPVISSIIVSGGTTSSSPANGACCQHPSAGEILYLTAAIYKNPV